MSIYAPEATTEAGAEAERARAVGPIQSPPAPGADALPSAATVATFVRETLGCGCPEALFARIAACRPQPGLLELRIGGRLLVHVRPASAGAELAGAVQHWTRRGLAVRDRRGYHRFRLVLTGHDPAALAQAAGPAFAAASTGDQCAHLHCLPDTALHALTPAGDGAAIRPAP